MQVLQQSSTFISEPIFCPNLLPAKASLALKVMLQHQPWLCDGYTLTVESGEDNADIAALMQGQIDKIDRYVITDEI